MSGPRNLTREARMGKTKPKAKPKAKDAPAKRKPTAEQVSDYTRQETLLRHRRKIMPLITAKKNADAALAKAYEFAKKEGVTKKEIEIAIKLGTEEGAEKLKAETERMLTVARWIGSKIGTQLELFPPKSKADEAFEDGRRAALDDQMAKPPSHLSQQASQQWLEGHAAGRAQLNERRLEGFKPLGEVVKDVAGTAPEPIGTEPATHKEAA